MNNCPQNWRDSQAETEYHNLLEQKLLQEFQGGPSHAPDFLPAGAQWISEKNLPVLLAISGKKEPLWNMAKHSVLF